MSVYVLHIDPPYKHARHYVGWCRSRDVSARVAEHLDRGPKASPLVRAALDAGCEVTVALALEGAGRDVEAWIKARRDVRRWCPACGVGSRPLPDPANISAKFRAAKPQRPTQRCEDLGNDEVYF